MNNSDLPKMLQAGFHVALGATNYLIEILSNPQKRTENLNQNQQLDQLLQEFAIKGEQLEGEAYKLMNAFFGGGHFSSKYSQYVERPNEQSFIQPFDIKNASIYGFVLESSLPKLQELCDKYLNKPANGQVEYRPAMPFVIITFGNLESLSSINKPDCNRGYIDEQEVVIWMLTVVGQQIGPLFKVDRMAWFVPYIFVNNSPALVSGREIYGIPKELGSFKIPPIEQIDEDIEICSLHAHTWKTLTSQTQAKWEKLLAVSRKNKAEKTQPSKRWSSYKDAVEDITQLLFGSASNIEIPGLGVSINPLEYLINLGYLVKAEFPVVMLKQFRDVEDGKRACYQAIVEIPMKIYEYHNGQLLSFGSLGEEFELEVYNCESHPIVKELGLKEDYAIDEKSVRLPVKLAYWLNFNFIVEKGTVIWKAE